MEEPGFENVAAAVAGATVVRPSGRITAVAGGTLNIAGLGKSRIGDRIGLGCGGGAEIVAAAGDHVTALPDRAPAGLSPGDAVAGLGRARLSPDASWVGRIVDPFGRPLDGRPLLPGTIPCNPDAAPPPASSRRPLGARLSTGLCAFNTLLPLVRGQRIGLFAGSGVGKSTLLASFARGIEADVVVLALIGERGREMREFVDHVLGPEGMARTVVIAATADRPAAERVRCLPAAMAVAERFRDAGKHVLLLADSITRHAEAQRQLVAARDEMPVIGGYPASTAPAIMGLAERAGPGVDGSGDITAIFTVLVQGSDMEGPLADILRGVLDGHVVLDRGIAERGRFPAVDLVRSVSRSLPGAASDHEMTLISEARRLISAYERSEMMIRAGLYSTGSDKTLDAAVEAWPKLDAFMGKAEPAGVSESYRSLARCLSRGRSDLV